MTFVSPMRKVCKEVLTVHDLLFESHPQYFPSSTKYTLAPLVKRSAIRADVILTISEYSRNQIIERYRIAPERICLTPCAIDQSIFNPGDQIQSRRLVREAFQVEDFILSVGRIEPRKNHKSLVEAYAYLKAKGKSLPKLLLVGGRDFGYQATALLIREKNLEKDVLFLHSVSDHMLPHLYRAAMVMVYPSFAEGFGLPPLEAMACGCPVISSGTTGLAEVVGDSGWIIDPNHWPSIADSLWESIQDASRRRIYAQMGLERAAGFSWENSAKAIIGAYDRLG